MSDVFSPDSDLKTQGALIDERMGRDDALIHDLEKQLDEPDEVASDPSDEPTELADDETEVPEVAEPEEGEEAPSDGAEAEDEEPDADDGKNKDEKADDEPKDEKAEKADDDTVAAESYRVTEESLDDFIAGAKTVFGIGADLSSRLVKFGYKHGLSVLKRSVSAAIRAADRATRSFKGRASQYSTLKTELTKLKTLVEAGSGSALPTENPPMFSKRNAERLYLSGKPDAEATIVSVSALLDSVVLGLITDIAARQKRLDNLLRNGLAGKVSDPLSFVTQETPPKEFVAGVPKEFVRNERQITGYSYAHPLPGDSRMMVFLPNKQLNSVEDVTNVLISCEVVVDLRWDSVTDGTVPYLDKDTLLKFIDTCIATCDNALKLNLKAATLIPGFRIDTVIKQNLAKLGATADKAEQINQVMVCAAAMNNLSQRLTITGVIDVNAFIVDILEVASTYIKHNAKALS